MQRVVHSFKAYFKKELMEGFRTHKFLVLAIGILFFSIADPIFIKFMPAILESQMKGIDFSGYLSSTQTAAMANYTKTLYEIGTLIIVFTLMGLISGERSKKTLTIPVSMGCRTGGMLMGKLSVYGGCLAALTLTGLTIAYFYSSMIFTPDPISYLSVIKAGVFYSIYYIYLISVIMLVNSLVEKPYIAGITTLLAAYGLPLLQNLKGWGRFIPNTIIKDASRFTAELSSEAVTALFSTVIIILVLNVLTAWRLRKISYI